MLNTVLRQHDDGFSKHPLERFATQSKKGTHQETYCSDRLFD